MPPNLLRFSYNKKLVFITTRSKNI